MSLNIALTNAISALQTNSQALDVTAQNISNANTEGYSRKVVEQQAVSIAGVGAGVKIAGISRIANEFLSKEMRLATSELNSNSTTSAYYSRMQDLFGSPGSNSSLSSAINDLAVLFQALSDTPEDVALRTELIGKAKLVAQQFNTMSAKIEGLRLEVDREIAASTTEVSNQLNQIQTLNLKIAEGQTLALGTSELEDQRDIAMAKISKEMEIRNFGRANGEVVIFTSSGRMLIDRTVNAITHVAATQFDPGLNLAGGSISGIMLGGVDVTSEITLGRIAALVEMRDKILPNLHSQIQELATSLHDEINLLHNQGIGYPGLPSITGTRNVAATDVPVWTGIVRIAVLDTSGVVVESQDIDLATVTDIADLVTAINAGFAGPTTASVNANGKFSITTTSTNRLALNEMTSAVTIGSETLGLSGFLGLNDFFATAKDYDDYRTGHQSTATTALGLAGTLTFSGGFGTTTVNYAAGDNLTNIAANISLNGALAAQNITASVVTDGGGFRLRIFDTDGNNFFITDNSTLISSQDIKPRDTGITGQFAVRADLANDPSLISRGQLGSGAMAPGIVGLTAGDKTMVQKLSNRFNASIDFAPTGLLAASRTTLAQYATEILALNATQANAATDTLTSREILVDSLKARIGAVAGVNLDEEMARLIILENAYAAAARVVTVTQNLFDLLTDMVI